MSGDTPGPTPEGQLIRQVRDLSIPRLSIRTAAKRIDLSAEQWGYVERGYRPTGAGQPPRPFSPPAATLAKMAHALRITPERLESEGQRPDAAEILREILQREKESTDSAPSWLPDSPDNPSHLRRGTRPDDASLLPFSDSRTAANQPYADDVYERLLRLRDEGITDPSGEQVFPGEHERADAKTWDGIADRWSIRARVWMIADLRRIEAERTRRAKTG